MDFSQVLAEGLLFTPKALIRDVSGMLDIFIFAVSLVWVFWMPSKVEPNSMAQFLMLLRCSRPLRIFILVRIIPIQIFVDFPSLLTCLTPHLVTSGSAYEASGDRVVQGFQGDFPCGGSSHCSHLRVRQHRCPHVRNEVRGLQRPHNSTQRKLYRWDR